MKKIIPLLAIILGVQLLLIAYFNYTGTDVSRATANAALLSFEKDKVDGFVVNLPDDKTITLVKQDGKWLSSEQNNFPADSAKITGLLDKLQDLKHGLPVATSQSALARFKVAEKDFERRIQLKQSDKVVADLYLGDSAGARESYARRHDDNAVYSIALGAYDVSDKAADWLDKTVLDINKDDVTKISLADWTLSRLTLGEAKATTADSKAEASDKPTQDSNSSTADADQDVGDKAASKPAKSERAIWQTEGLAAGETLKQSAINGWLSSLTSARFAAVLGQEAKPEYGLDKPELDVTITHKGGERRYQLARLKANKPEASADAKDEAETDAADTADDKYVLKLSDRVEYFELAGYTGNLLLDISKDAWVEKPKVEEVADEADVTEPESDPTEAGESSQVEEATQSELMPDKADESNQGEAVADKVTQPESKEGDVDQDKAPEAKAEAE